MATTLPLIHADTKWEAFLEFHRSNPNIYVLFDRFTRQMIASGHKQGSARQIMERIRWYIQIETTDHHYKINNNHIPRYARLWMQCNPGYHGFFVTRKI